uniref:Uncharacterized protein n=1 Tax=Pithovirus LCPAC102 TaxID=2506587 RepID=A0A481Z643_9VIRU|nr:MAG: uncharacterized protein LCPAC102_00300 [Pithovirus LCPAC102]
MTEVNIKTLPNHNIVIYINDKRVFYNEIIRECYESHNIELSNDDIEWATNITTDYILDDYNLDTGYSNKLILFILYGFKQLQTGKLAFIYNYELDDSIKNKDTNKLKILLNIPATDRWQEVTKNSSLNTNELNELYQIRNIEMITLINVISEGKNLTGPIYITNNPKSLLDMDIHKNIRRETQLGGFIKACDRDNKIYEYNNITLYESCLEGVCIEQNNNIKNTMLNNKTSIIIMPIDTKNNNSFSGGEIQCYQYNTLIYILSVDNTINSDNKIKLNNNIKNILSHRYATDIKIYKYYIKYKNTLNRS